MNLQMHHDPLKDLVSRAIAGPERFELPWYCHGISPMHRAMIYRTAKTKLAESYGPNYQILWNPIQELTKIDLEYQLGQCLEWIDAKHWTKQISQAEKSVEGFVQGERTIWGNASIRVLWCWNQSNWRDFLNATPWMATGVVYNLATLRSWVSRSLELGKWQPAVGPTSRYLL